MGTPSSPIYLRLTGVGISVYGSTPTFGYAFYNAATAGTAVTDATPTGSVLWSGAPSSTSNAGIYSLTYSSGITLGNSAYTLSPGSAVNWTVTPAPLTITASNASKVYGQVPTLTGFSSSGLVGGQTIGSVNLSSSGAAATEGVTGSPYVITASAATGGTFDASNYSISYVNGNLTVTPLPILIAAVSGSTRVFNGTTDAAANLLTVSNAINGDTVMLSGTAGLAGSAAGTQAVNSIAGLSVNNPNYTLVGATSSGGVVLSHAPLTVTASNASKVYGQTPTLSAFTSSGLVAGQTIGSVSLSSAGTTATAGVTGSPYDIIASAAGDGTFTPDNYNISYVNGSLKVAPLPILVAAVSGATRVFNGTTDAAANLLTVSNAINGDTVVLSGTAGLLGSAAGTQTVSRIAGLSVTNPNYTLVGATSSGSVVITADQKLDNIIGIANAVLQPPLGVDDSSIMLANFIAQSLSRPPNGFANVLTPLPQLVSAFGLNTPLTIISSPSAGQPTQIINLAQARSMMRLAGGQGSAGSSDAAPDVRVPVSRNSLAEIVNGGVRLPVGVEQELFVVQAD